MKAAVAALLVVAACGGPPNGPARDELIGAGDRRLAAGEPAAALADYRAATRYGALPDAARAREQRAIEAIVEAELAAARASGDDLGAFERIVALREALRGLDAPAPPSLDAAIEQLGLLAVEHTVRQQGWDGGDASVIPAIRRLRRIAEVAGSAAVTAQVDRATAQARELFVARARAAARDMFAADLHLRIARALGAELPADAARVIAEVEAQLATPVVVIVRGCDELASLARGAADDARPFALRVELDVTCAYSTARSTAEVDGVTHDAIAHELRVRGSARFRFAGQDQTLPVDSFGNYKAPTDEGSSGRAEAIRLAVEHLERAVDEQRRSVRAAVAGDARGRLASADWIDRDAAAVVAWRLDRDEAAAAALERAYGLDRAALAALDGDGTLPPVDNLATTPAFTLPDPDEGPAVRAADDHRRRYGDDDRISAEARPIDFWRPGAGVAFVARQQPLATVERTHAISAYLGGGPMYLFVEVARTELGGDGNGWAIGWAPRVPLSERLLFTYGLTGGKVSGERGDAHRWMAIPLALYVRTKFALLSSGVDLNVMQAFGGAKMAPETRQLSPWTSAIEIPLPVGPRIYVRGEVSRYLGGGDGWYGGLTVGIRTIFADKWD